MDLTYNFAENITTVEIINIFWSWILGRSDVRYHKHNVVN